MVEPEKAKEMNIKIAHNYLMYSRWFTEDAATELAENAREVEAETGVDFTR